MKQGAKRERNQEPNQADGGIKRAAHDETLPAVTQSKVAVAQNIPEEPNEFTTLPLDVFAHLLSFMSLVDVARFALASKGIHTRMSTTKANALWLKYIQVLHEIDASVPLPTKAQLGEQGYFQTVIKQAKAIYQRQLKDIAYIKRYHPAYLDELNVVDLTMDLKGLKTRQNLLARINSELIRPHIHLDNTTLMLDGRRLTCIPESLLADKELADYWQRLTYLDCSRNELHTLPESLGNCAALEDLDCRNNQLHALPDSLGNCGALQYLLCDNNQLREIPPSLLNRLGSRWSKIVLAKQTPSEVEPAPAMLTQYNEALQRGQNNGGSNTPSNDKQNHSGPHSAMNGVLELCEVDPTLGVFEHRFDRAKKGSLKIF